MKTVADVLQRTAVWVNPSHRLDSALWLMRGHNLDGLPVLDGAKLVGMLSYKHLAGENLQRIVGEVMDARVVALSTMLTIREATDLMLNADVERAAVLEPEGALAGVISHRDLLAELRFPLDPLTELCWSDNMREWAVDQLREGREITLLFLDVNDFGQFNKRFGHVIGDTVLRNVANILRDLMDDRRDALCRYGGDEFCIASLRSAAEAAELAETIEREVDSLRVMEMPNERVSVSIGQRGGRRHRERDPIHYAATLNNLINLASQDCMAKKERRRRLEDGLGLSLVEVETQTGPRELESPLREPEAPPRELEAGGPSEAGGARGVQEPAGVFSAGTSERENRATFTALLPPDREPMLNLLRLAALEVSLARGAAHVHVELERLGGGEEEIALEEPLDAPLGRAKTGRKTVTLQNHVSDLSRMTEGPGVLELVAEATLMALRHALPEKYDVRLDEVMQTSTVSGASLVIVTGHFVTPGDTRPISGSVFVGDDIYRATAAATLAATNRQLAQLFARAVVAG